MTMKTYSRRRYAIYIFVVWLLNCVSVGVGQASIPRPLPLGGWSTPSPGWVSPVAPSSIIDIFGGIEATGQGSAQSSHSSSITATGSGSGNSGWKASVEDPVAGYIMVRDP